VAHITSANDVECLEDLKKLLSYLPQSNKETTAKLPYELNDEVQEQLATIILITRISLDMHGVIAGIIDEDSFFEVHKNYAENIIVGFARLGGRSIGIVANQPLYLAGVLDVNSSKSGKIYSFLRLFQHPISFGRCTRFLTRNGSEWHGLSFMVPNYYISRSYRS
jgi:propionyl-CoA carboxylase beta chain